VADNTELSAGSGGDIIATDEVGGAVKHQLVKVEFGGDGVATMVSATDPLPVKLSDGTDTLLISAGGAALVDGSGVTQPISNASITTIAGAVSGTEMQVDVVAALPAGTNNIGDVDVLTLPALVAGTANIGDVDVLTVPAPLSTTGSGTEATALRVTLATDSTGVVSVDDNGSSLSVDWAGTAPVTGSGTATGALRVELANNGTGVIATVGTITNAVTVAGGAAHASPASGNPNLIAGRASAAIPTDVGADGDVASLWTNRNGAQVVLQAPHVGLNSDPWNLVHEGVQYTSQQTSAVMVTGGASEKIVVTQCQIQAYATTAFTMQLYFGTGAFSRGTSRTIFDGEFAPSATLKPGIVLNGPFIAGTNGDDLMVTTSAAGSVTISVWYYVVT
jgi:hypothetical protein